MQRNDNKDNNCTSKTISTQTQDRRIFIAQEVALIPIKRIKEVATQTEESYLSEARIIPNAPDQQELYPGYYPHRIPTGTIPDYDFRFVLDFGIANLVPQYGSEELNSWEISLVQGKPWWATTEKIVDGSGFTSRYHFPYLELLRRLDFYGEYPPSQIPVVSSLNHFLSVAEELPFYDKESAFAFEKLNQYHAPAVPFYDNNNQLVLGQHLHQEPLQIYLTLWSPDCLSDIEKFYNVRPKWLELSDSRNQEQANTWINQHRIEEQEIPINKRVHIFLYKLARFKETFYIHNNLLFTLFWTRYFFNEAFISIPTGNKEERVSKARVIFDYTSHLSSLIWIHQAQLDNYWRASDINIIMHTGYCIIELQDFLRREHKIVAALTEDLEDYPPLPYTLPDVGQYMEN